jgi:hypothetical protein
MPTDKNLLEWAALVLADARASAADLLRARAQLASTVSHVRMFRGREATPAPPSPAVATAPAADTA